MTDGSVKVCEIYPAILGESALAGRPCTIVRLSGCNLRCVYCDTEHAWRGGAETAIKRVLDTVKRRGHELVLVTGGEPLLQPAAPKLMAELIDAGHRVVLETNGSIDVSPVPAQVHVVMDVKTPGSGAHDANLWSNLEKLKAADELKIVLTGREDYEWAGGVLEERGLPGRFDVALSAAHGKLSPSELARWILDDRLPVRLGVQIHKCIFGPDARQV